MSDDLRSAFEAAAIPESGETAAPSTPSATEQLAAQPEPAGTPEPEASTGSTEPSTPQGDDLRSYLESVKGAHPEQAEVIDRIHREMEAAWTPKLQRAAELEKQFGSEDIASDLEFVRRVNEVARVSPAAAAQMLEDARQHLLRQQGAPPAPSAYPPPAPEPEGMEWASEGERYLYQQQQQILAWQQQQQIAHNQAMMEREFQAIQQEFGREVPQAQREAAAQWCIDRRLGADAIGIAWRGLYGAQLSRQLGRDEGAQVGAQKAALGNRPSNIAPPASQPAPEPKSLREAVAMLGYGIREE